MHCQYFPVKNLHNTWEHFGGEIITDEANSTDDFGKSADRSLVISVYLLYVDIDEKKFGKLCTFRQIPQKVPSKILPHTVVQISL